MKAQSRVRISGENPWQTIHSVDTVRLVFRPFASRIARAIFSPRGRVTLNIYAKAAFAAVLVFASSEANAESVGNASAIIPNASQQSQGTRSDLRLKDNIIRNAELVTADAGALEVTFNDGSKLTMGQNSRLTVDEYVYGQGSASKQTVRYTKGLFRFLSGVSI